MAMHLAVLSEWHLILALIIVFLLFGGKKLPELARGIGKALEEFRRASHEVKNEITREPEPPPQKMSLPEPPPDGAAPTSQMMASSVAPTEPGSPVAPAASSAPESKPPPVAKETRSAQDPSAA